jgi:hypothetical protein
LSFIVPSFQLICPTGNQLRRSRLFPVQSCRKKYFAFPVGQIKFTTRASRLDKRGVRVVTNVGAGCDGRGWCRKTSGAGADGEVVWSWRPDAGVKLATMLRIAPMTGARKPGHKSAK